MLPERLIFALVIFPVGVHVIEEGGGAGGCDDGADVGVGASGVAVGVEGAIAVVRPETVYSPGLRGTGGRVGVPELGLRRRVSAIEAA